MTTTTLVWIDVMGADPCYPEAYLDRTHRRVLVTPDTLGSMIDATRTAGLFDDETTTGLIDEMTLVPVLHGLRDVTDIGGGWDRWLEGLIG